MKPRTPPLRCERSSPASRPDFAKESAADVGWGRRRFARRTRGGGASWSTGDGSGDSDPAPPSLLNLVQDKWGLRVESGKAVMDLLVVEKAERPIAN
jgi:uncharacterized protein (TIGR03435 family)